VEHLLYLLCFNKQPYLIGSINRLSPKNSRKMMVNADRNRGEFNIYYRGVPTIAGVIGLISGV
jgi:hypothetical protein